jgi:hypothetical protein
MFIFASLSRRAAPVRAELIQMSKSKINKYKPNFQNKKRHCSVKILVIAIIKYILAETKAVDSCYKIL